MLWLNNSPDSSGIPVHGASLHRRKASCTQRVKGLLLFKSRVLACGRGRAGNKGKGEQGNGREKHVAETEENVAGKSNPAWGVGMGSCCAAKPHLPGQAGAGLPPN